MQNGAGDYEVFDNFTFFALDGVTGERSAENASCRLVVLPRDDPPRPRDFSASVSAGVQTVLSLNSSDVDDNISFAVVYVASYPKLGLLFPVAADGTVSNCTVPEPSQVVEQLAWPSLFLSLFLVACFCLTAWRRGWRRRWCAAPSAPRKKPSPKD